MGILDHRGHLDSPGPVVIIEGLVVGETEEGVLVEVSVIGQLHISGRGAGALGHVLTHHEELESPGADHLARHDGPAFGVG